MVELEILIQGRPYVVITVLDVRSLHVGLVRLLPKFSRLLRTFLRLMRDRLLLLENYYRCFWPRRLVGVRRVIVILSVGEDRRVHWDLIHGQDLLEVFMVGAEVLHHV